MEEVLGIKPLGLNDALQPPMSEVFSMKQATWNYKARVPAILRSTKLPLPAATAEDRQGAIEPATMPLTGPAKQKISTSALKTRWIRKVSTWCSGPGSRENRNRTPLNAMAGT